MELGDSLLQLYNLFEELIKSIGKIWDWLFEPFIIFDGVSFKLFQWTITLIPKIEFTPILMIGASGIITLIVWWLVKALVPLA